MAEKLTIAVEAKRDLPRGLPVSVETTLGGISVWLEAARRVRLRDAATGDEIPVQASPAGEGRVELTFQLPHAVPEGEEALFEAEVGCPKPPRYDFEVTPEPGGRLSIRHRGRVLAGYVFGPSERLPYVYPLTGPSGVPVTRVGHPHDPEGHGHHKSLWIAHKDVDGTSFWEEGSKGGIRHERFLHLLDGPVFAEFASENVWEAQGKALLREGRSFRFYKLPSGEVLVRIVLSLRPAGRGETRLGRTNFGLLSVRVAKPMSVLDGDGEILDSEGRRNEAEVLGKRARWCAYIGTPAGGAREAVALLDSPGNPRHPTYWHVRDDGWMCASLTMRAGLRVRDELRLTYWLCVMRAAALGKRLEALYESLFKGAKVSVREG